MFIETDTRVIQLASLKIFLESIGFYLQAGSCRVFGYAPYNEKSMYISFEEAVQLHNTGVVSAAFRYKHKRFYADGENDKMFASLVKIAFDRRMIHKVYLQRVKGGKLITTSNHILILGGVSMQQVEERTAMATRFIKNILIVE